VLRPYGRRPPPRPPCLVDRWTGSGWRLLERHETRTAAPPAAALAALFGLHIRELPAVRLLFALRGLRFSAEMTLLEFFSTRPFVLLDEEPGRELVGGVLVPPRDAAGRRSPPAGPAAFREAVPHAPLAAVATFRAEPAPGGGSRLWTETWARASSALPAIAFAAYWLAVGPFSAWIRRMFLRAARDRSLRGAGATPHVRRDRRGARGARRR
jgi:hypothetical protein